MITPEQTHLYRKMASNALAHNLALITKDGCQICYNELEDMNGDLKDVLVSECKNKEEELEDKVLLVEINNKDYMATRIGDLIVYGRQENMTNFYHFMSAWFSGGYLDG